MTSYLVSWKIDIEADSPRQAAQTALEIQRDPESIAVFFDVWEKKIDSFSPVQINLAEKEKADGY